MKLFQAIKEAFTTNKQRLRMMEEANLYLQSEMVCPKLLGRNGTESFWDEDLSKIPQFKPAICIWENGDLSICFLGLEGFWVGAEGGKKHDTPPVAFLNGIPRFE